jgi:CubicO group peptidase (beta-lactamase class C family)
MEMYLSATNNFFQPTRMSYRVFIGYFLFLGFVQGQMRTEQIDKYVETYVETGDFSGCILITQKDSTIYEACYGYANQAFQVPNTNRTKFKIGSVSKQFTAAAILILEAKGLLQTSDTLSNFFPNNSNAASITLDQLLKHTSGIIDIYDIPDFHLFSCKRLSLRALSEILLESGLTSDPGVQYLYSNGGYTLLARVIEIVSGQSYGDFLAEELFAPLQMNASGHQNAAEDIPYLALGYDPLGYASHKATNFQDPELLQGSGSLYSTLGDLELWIRSVKNQSLLSADSYEKFLMNYGNNYGYGISVYQSFDQDVFGHDGRINGYIADYLYYRESDISIIVLGNIQTGVTDFFRNDIAAILFGKAYKSSAKTIPPGKDIAMELNSIPGTYEFAPAFHVYVEILGGRLQARANQGSYSELVLLEDGRFFSRTLYSYIEFVMDQEGHPIQMVWTNNDGTSFVGVRK